MAILDMSVGRAAARAPGCPRRASRRACRGPPRPRGCPKQDGRVDVSGDGLHGHLSHVVLLGACAGAPTREVSDHRGAPSLSGPQRPRRLHQAAGCAHTAARRGREKRAAVRPCACPARTVSIEEHLFLLVLPALGQAPRLAEEPRRRALCRLAARARVIRCREGAAARARVRRAPRARPALEPRAGSPPPPPCRLPERARGVPPAQRAAPPPPPPISPAWRRVRVLQAWIRDGFHLERWNPCAIEPIVWFKHM